MFYLKNFSLRTTFNFRTSSQLTLISTQINHQEQKMSSQDAHTGGDLSEMAATGTKIPNDAGKMNIIPSVPRPDQDNSNPGGIGSTSQAFAVDNPIDIPRQNKDMGLTDEIITGTGDQMPSTVEAKRLHYPANEPRAKGHERDHKHVAQTSDFERFQGEGGKMEDSPGDTR